MADGTRNRFLIGTGEVPDKNLANIKRRPHWVIEYLTSKYFQENSYLLYSSMVKDSLLALGDQSFFKSLFRSKASILTKNILPEINQILGIISNEPRAVEAHVKSTSEESNKESVEELRDLINAKLSSIPFSIFYDCAIPALKNRLIMGAGWTYYAMNKLSNKIENRQLSPLQVYEHQTSNKQDEFIIFEDYESDQYVQANYIINQKELDDIKRNFILGDGQNSEYGEPCDQWFTFFDNTYKKHLLYSYDKYCNETASREEKPESIMVYNPSSDSYKRVRVTTSGSGKTKVLHAFFREVVKDKIITEEGEQPSVARYNCRHCVFIGSKMVYEEDVLSFPIVKLADTILDESTSIYRYRGSAFRACSHIIAYNTLLSLMITGAINSPQQKMLIKEGLISTSKDNVNDQLQESIIQVLSQDDQKISDDVMQISLPTIDANIIATLQWLSAEIKSSLGILDQSQLSNSAQQEYMRIHLQQVGLMNYTNSLSIFMKSSAKAIVDILSKDKDMIYMDKMMNEIDIKTVLSKDSDSYAKMQINKLKELSRICGGVSLSLKFMADLMGIDRSVMQKMEEAMQSESSSTDKLAEEKDAQIEKDRSKAILDKASSMEKLANAIVKIRESP